MVLAFSPCADVLSMDAFLRKKRGVEPSVAPNLAYMLPFKIIWLLLAVIYCCSGFHKLWDTGLYWALSENITNQIQLEWVEQYDAVRAFRIDQYPIVLRILSVGVILMEILYPLLIVKAGTRIFALFSAWALHLSAGYFLYIDFIHLRLVHLSYINWNRMGKWLRRKKASLDDFPKYGNREQIFKMPLLYVGGSMVAINLVFGILQINSWPFSSYPSYSSIVKNEVSLVGIHALDANNRPVDVKKIAQSQDFRWENIRPFEERIAERVSSNDTSGLQGMLDDYWLLWTSKVRGLHQIRSVEMVLLTTPIQPERRHLVLDSVYLGKVQVLQNE
jgi:hypothetical protein